MRIEFDSSRDSALDAAAIAQAMMVYVNTAARQQEAPPPETVRTPDAAFGTPPAPIETAESDQEDDNAPAAAPGTVDSRGFPWDERIHAKTRDGGGTLNADGSWRGRRGVSKELVASVEAEYAAPKPIGAAIPATVEAYGAVMTQTHVGSGDNVLNVPQPPVTVAPPPPAAPTEDTFESFFAKLTAAQASDPTLMQRAVAAAAEMGINLAGLAAQPALIADIKTKLGMA